MGDDLKRLLRDDSLLTQAATGSFMEIDNEKSGLINSNQLAVVMNKVCSSLGITKPSGAQVKEVLMKIENKKQAKVTFDEYLKFLKTTLKKHLENGVNEEHLRKNQRKDDDMERKIGKQSRRFQKYLEESGLPAAFQVIYTEILEKKIEPDKVFTYVAVRLRQIGREVARFLPNSLAA